MWVHGDNAQAAFLSIDGKARRLINGKPATAPMARGGDVTMRRAGKKAAGRSLDGRTWDEYPRVAVPA
jgi:protein gp37